MPDLHATAAAYADEDTVDTDFVHHLVRGADLLQLGDPDHARSMLERALRLRPDSERGQNLLALSYFKLGLYDRADEIYRALVTAHPSDPSLRVNLGLVMLKTGRETEAIEQFSWALELAPDHKKAENYIGLAYLQKREFAEAKAWFERAGNTAMAERASLSLAPPALGEVGSEALAVLDSSEIPFTPPEATPLASSGVWVARESLLVVPVPEPAPDLLAFSEASLVVAPQAEVPFALSASMVTVNVKGELFSRVDELVATFGALDFAPQFKRFRGRVTDKPFGEASRRMMRVTGEGRLWIAVEGRHFQILEIGDEAAYFREDVLFSFEETLLFENGRVPSKTSTDLSLVHLRGRGRALLVSRHRPRAVEVRKGEPCRLPVDVLLAWHGDVAPRLVSIGPESEGEGRMAVELSGEGRALIDASL